MGDNDLRFYLSILTRRLPWILTIAGIVTGAGLIVAYLMPPTYQASARILVEPPQISSDLARPTVQTNPLEQLQIIEQELTTRENLVDLARRLNIYGETGKRLSDAGIVANLRERTSLELIPLERNNGQGATVFSVSFIAREPELAATVVNDLVDNVLVKNAGLRASKAEDTSQFFDREVERLASELEKREAALLEFRNANKNALPDSIDFRRTQLSNQQERMLLLEREESTLRARRNNLVRIFETTGQIAGSGPASVEQDMLRELKRALSEQLSMFSADSPNVVSLRARIAALQAEVQANQAQSSDADGPSDLDLQLSDIDERLGFIEREKASIAAYVADLEQTIDATPQNETSLNALERSRNNIQAQYNSAVAKLAEASTGEQIEIGAKGGRFTLVEPATPPQDRLSPNRKRIAGVGLVLGILLGVGAVVALELMNRSVRRPEELTKLLQKPPLGTIPYIWKDGEQETRKRRLSVSLAAAVCAAFVVAGAVQHFRTPLATAFEHLIERVDSSKVM